MLSNADVLPDMISVPILREFNYLDLPSVGLLHWDLQKCHQIRSEHLRVHVLTSSVSQATSDSPC